ncbi:hypothetical protein Pfo_013733 [Paulownia fortunei]|nr:hypothetical protein Pfo_013733 [Paulownia fortunei]
MDDSENSISKAEAEIKTSGDEGKENAAERNSGTVEGKTEERKVDLGQILEVGPPLDLVLKPFVEEFTQAAESLVPSYVTEVEKEVEKLVLVSDPWASLKNLEPAPESSLKGTEDTLPTSDENVGESLEAVKSRSAEPEEAGLDENPRSTHTQPFVAVTAATRASWMNCCGLIDVLRPSDQ